MKAILDKDPSFKPAISQLEYLSADEKLRIANEEYLDAERDLISIKEQGKLEGKLEGKLQILTKLVQLRFGKISEKDQKVIEACISEEKMEQASAALLDSKINLNEVLEILRLRECD